MADGQRRNRNLSRRLQDMIKPIDVTEEVLWEDINRRIKDGEVIPILSNSVRNDKIFESALGILEQDPAEVDRGEKADCLTVDEELAEVWAKSIGYPLQDRYDLPIVAQFNRVESDDDDQAKAKYLTFLKLALLNLLEDNPEYRDTVDELRGQMIELNFSDIVQELDILSSKSGDNDSLNLLARLPLPIYITTSYYDFLERAIRAEGREPRTQVCFWCGELTNVDDEHRTDHTYSPSVAEPLVYHLHGLEKYPRSMVLSEDDYLDFLVAVSQDTDTRYPIIPLYLRQALTESSLILLGYRMQDWDFRVLFRGVINRKGSSLRMYSLIIQLNPEEQYGIENCCEAREYLKAYFQPSRFKVEWGHSDGFIQKLWSEWNSWRSGS